MPGFVAVRKQLEQGQARGYVGIMRGDRYADLLDAIYATAVSPDRTGDMLGALGQAFNCHFAGYVTQTNDRMRHRGTAWGLEAAEYAAFLHQWHRTNPFGRRAPVRAAGAVMRTGEMMPAAEMVRTRIFAEFLDPHDMHHGLRLDVWLTARAASVVSLMRPWRHGVFEAREVALASRLMPHLQAAAAVLRRLNGVDLMQRAAWASLDALRHPVLVLDGDRRVAHANLAGAALLAAGDGLACAKRELRASAPSHAGRLGALIGRAVPRAGEVPRAGALHLPRPSGGPHLALVAMPLQAGTGWDLPGAPAALLCVGDPAAAARLPPAMLAELFGLTGAEAALASDLLGGGDLRGIATCSGRSLATVRTHLARLMAKTGTARQAELTRMLAGLPGWPEDRHLTPP